MQIHYTQAEVDAFVKYFDIESTKRIKFSDFGKAFLPNNRDYSLKILQRTPKNIKREKKLSEVFNKQTLVQYMIVWRILLRQIWEIEQKKKQYCSANNTDAERAFFQIDHRRLGYIDLNSVSISILILFSSESTQRNTKIPRVVDLLQMALCISLLMKTLC